MASLFQSRYTYFPEEVVLTLPSKYIFSGKSIVLLFYYFREKLSDKLYKRRIYGRSINNSNR